MIGPARVQIILVSALSIGPVATVGLILRQSWRLADAHRQHAADQQSLRALRETIRQGGSHGIPAESGEQTRVNYDQAAIARQKATIVGLDRELSEAHATVIDLQTQLLKSNDEREKALATANERNHKVQEDLQSQLDALKQELDSA